MKRIHNMLKKHFLLLLFTSMISNAFADTTVGNLHFTNTPLINNAGTSEPSISIASNGAMAITDLHQPFNPFNPNTSFGTELWTGIFGSIPVFKGLFANVVQTQNGTQFGGSDNDIDIGSTGTLHGTDLIFSANSVLQHFTVGVSAIACPHAADSIASNSFNINDCSLQVIDTTQVDREWITSDNVHVYISYHDSGNSNIIHVQRSDDDGFTWKKVADPLVGQDGITANATFNNEAGPIKADPISHNVYSIFVAGEAQNKGLIFSPNNVYISRSNDMGKSWHAFLVYSAPAQTSFANVFPVLAVDPVNGKLYAAFSDGHSVLFSMSSDQGSTWSTPVAININPANTAILPAIDAFNGIVDVAYYGTTALSQDDPTANWFTYIAQTMNGISFTQSQINSSHNHIGGICTSGLGCLPGTRNMREDFEVAINPMNGLAGIIYANDTLAVDANGHPITYIELATQLP